MRRRDLCPRDEPPGPAPGRHTPVRGTQRGHGPEDGGEDGGEDGCSSWHPLSLSVLGVFPHEGAAGGVGNQALRPAGQGDRCQWPELIWGFGPGEGT